MAGPVGMDPAPFVRDLTVRDIDNLAWSGDSGHREHMVSELERVPAGEIEYLVVALPDSGPAGEERLVGKGAINYVQAPGCGVLTQLSVVADLQSRGIGSLLIRTMEQRVRAQGWDRAEIAVELDNPRAQRLYERLGYQEYDQRPESWMQTASDGKRFRYHTTCTWLRKDLTVD